MKRRVAGSFWVCLVLAIGCCWCPTASWAQNDNVANIHPPEGRDPYGVAKAWDARLQSLEREKAYDRVLAETKYYMAWLHEQKDEKLNVIFMPKAYEAQAAGFAGQGYYGEAVGAAKMGTTYPNDAGRMKELYDKYQKLNSLQGEYYKLSLDLNQQRNQVQERLLGLNEQKNKILNGLLQQPSISPKDLKAAQDQIRSLDKEREGLSAKLHDVTYRMEKYLKDGKFDGVVLNHSQASEISQLSKQADEMAARDNELGGAVKIKLLEVVEKSGQIWKELNAKMESLARIQNQIRGLQKEIAGVMNRKPLSDKDKKAIKDMNARMDKLNAEYQKMFDGVEESYMKATGFDAMNPNQVGEFKKRLSDFRENREAINREEKRIESFIAEMDRSTVKYGDLNGDGKVDVTDLNLVLQSVFGFQKYNRNPAADVDGDGRVTFRDFLLIREAVVGQRKVFPADPKYIPGDVNGDGKLNLNDALQLLRAFGKEPRKVQNSWDKMFDANGDGVLDSKDGLAVLNKVLGLEPKPVIQATGTVSVATASVPVASETQAPGNEATGTVAVPGGDTTNQNGNTSAGSMGDN